MKKTKFGFLFEQTVVVPNSKLEILEESVTDDNRARVHFRSLLQESGVKNQNHRVYSSTVCESIVAQLSPKAKSRNLLMEVK
jgi:hypothetical protein